jgi:predicted nucleic acid-binding protein
MKIFVDANVLFTAAYSPMGKAATLLECSALSFVTSDYAAEEARRNLLVKRPSALSALEKILEKIELAPSVQSGVCPIVLPLKDQPIFLSALMIKATHLLTGDRKDFGPFMNSPDKSAGLIIQTVSDFLASL